MPLPAVLLYVALALAVACVPCAFKSDSARWAADREFWFLTSMGLFTLAGVLLLAALLVALVGAAR